MLQRKQTIFLLLAVIALVLMPFFPIAKYYGDISYTLNLFNFKDLTGVSPFPSMFNIPLIFIWAITLILCITIIFLYKKRRLQLKLTSVAIAFIMVFLLLIFIYYTPMIEKEFNALNISTYYLDCVSVYLPIIIFLLLILAYKFINKDIKMIKSLDRIR
ncbi:DUF4293 domain-containing protein [Bacteroidales bacterium OttesenSCG-928-K22]|nr:DUF4293 domain-containing protein [Bacteroidales bacterium OttesenSCG-928-K22]